MDSLRLEIRNIICKTFDLDPKNLPEPLSADTVENWDSLGHLTLILEIEERFSINFAQEQIAELWNEDAIFNAVLAISGNQAKGD